MHFIFHDRVVLGDLSIKKLTQRISIISKEDGLENVKNNYLLV